MLYMVNSNNQGPHVAQWPGLETPDLDDVVIPGTAKREGIEDVYKKIIKIEDIFFHS